jgi:hypothetical protein
MNPGPFSCWHRLQLTLLRWFSVTLATVDGLLDVHWGERLLDRLADRWQTEIAQLDEMLVHLEKERHQLQSQAQALAVHAAAIYLAGRKLARDELRFDPADQQDEELLDASIDLLVKERLATIETEQIASGHYVYYLEPDWRAIQARLDEAANQADSEMADWLRESVRLIDEAFLPASNPGNH